MPEPAIGVALPTNRVRLSGPGLGGIVRALEATACRSVWVNDHLCAFPAGYERYPYTPSGVIDWEPELPQYEALAACAYVSAVTERLRIGTAVLVLPQRHPIEVAKAAATIADLAGGRFVLGVGAGWSRAEMRALGCDPSDRGRRLDEAIVVLRALWGVGAWPETMRFHHIPREAIIMEPRPLAGQVPPILVGGHSPAALERVCRLADGWLAVSRPTVRGLREAGRTLERLRARSERVLQGVLKVPVAGTGPDELAALEGLAGAPWDEVCLEFDRWDVDEACRLVDRLAG